MPSGQSETTRVVLRLRPGGSHMLTETFAGENESWLM